MAGVYFGPGRIDRAKKNSLPPIVSERNIERAVLFRRGILFRYDRVRTPATILIPNKNQIIV